MSNPPAELPIRPVDVVVKPNDTVARMGLNRLGDGKWIANVYALTGVQVTGTTQLLVEGAVEAKVNDLAASAGVVVASGSVVTSAGESRGVLWSSPDGAQFALGEILPSPITTTLGVALRGDDVPVVVGRSNEPRPSQLLVARRDGGGWVNTVLVPDATGYSVNGVAATGQTIVITGSYDRGLAGSAGVIWASTDGGATFQQLSNGLEEFKAIGEPIVMGTTFLATTEGSVNTPAKLLSSSDGVGWASTGLSLTSDNEYIDTAPSSLWSPAVFGDKLIASVSDLGANTAIFGPDGRGTIADGYADDSGTEYRSLLPYVIGGEAYSVFRSTGGYVVTTIGPNFTVGHRERVGPVASGVDLASLNSGVVAESVVYPVSSPGGTGPASAWNVRKETGWAVADESQIPVGARLLTTNGALDLWINSGAVDPADAGGGPVRGTAVRVRASNETSWPPDQLIASGPGGEYLHSAAGFQGGFLTVGYHSDRSDSGDYTYGPMISEYANGAWSMRPPPSGTPPQSWLSIVSASGDGDVLAVGGSETEGSSGDLLFTRDGVGAWSLVPSPFTGQTIRVVDVQSTPTAVVLLVQQDSSWFQYVFDAGAFTSSPINFDGADDVSPISLVEVAGTKYLVGTARGNLATHLAVWKLEGEQATSIEWPDRVTSIDLEADDVAVQDSHIVVGGTSRGQNLVWDLTINLA